MLWGQSKYSGGGIYLNAAYLCSISSIPCDHPSSEKSNIFVQAWSKPLAVLDMAPKQKQIVVYIYTICGRKKV